MAQEINTMRDFVWDELVLAALAEVEAVKDDPSTWISLDEFWQD